MADLENKEKAVKEKKEKTKAAPKKNKVKLSKRIGQFFRNYWSEIKKIVWCSPEQTMRFTGLALAAIVVVGGVIGGLDYLFNKAIIGLGKLY